MMETKSNKYMQIGLLFCLWLCTGTPGALAQETDLGNYVERQAQLLNIPALSYAVTGPDSILMIGTAGRKKGEVDGETLFRIGSVTKTFTAFAVARLVDEGKIDFDDSIQKHLPDFQLKDEAAAGNITVRHLLAHTSGLSQWSGHNLRAQQRAEFDHIGLSNLPGDKFEYSSLNYIILGQLIQKVSGQSYEAYLRKELFEPAGMGSCTSVLSAARQRGLAQGHRYYFGLTLPHAPTEPPPALVPAGYLACSTVDLAKYLRIFLNRGRIGDTRILSPERINDMLTPWNGSPVGPGMGWGIGRESAGHAGNTSGFSARLSILAADSLGIVLLASANSGPLFAGTGQIMEAIVQIVQGGENPPVFPKEMAVKTGILILLLAGFFRMAVKLRQWLRAGRPVGLRWDRKAIQPIVFEVAMAFVVLYVLPRWIGVPLRVLLEYFFDLGLAMIIGVITGIITAALKSFLASHEPAIMQ